MTQAEIIAMAKEARVSEMGLNIDGSIHLLGLFERFAALVAEKAAAQEREACAQVCERMQLRYPHTAEPIECAYAIRARGTKEGV